VAASLKASKNYFQTDHLQRNPETLVTNGPVDFETIGLTGMKPVKDEKSACFQQQDRLEKSSAA